VTAASEGYVTVTSMLWQAVERLSNRSRIV